MLTEAWTPLPDREYFKKAWKTTARNVCIRAGRGGLKTELAMRYTVRHLPVRKPWLHPRYAIMLPTNEQARDAVWVRVKDLVPEQWIASTNETKMRIETVWGSYLHVMGMDRAKRREGVQWDGVIIDERQDHKPGILLSVLPAMSHRNPFLWQIGSSKRFGAGMVEFNKAFDKGLEGDANYLSLRWSNEGLISEEARERAREALSAKDFSEQYEANTEAIGGSIYWAFDDDNINTCAVYQDCLPIYVGLDFNVNPMCWCLCHYVQDMLLVFDEINVEHVNTPQTLTELISRYPGHRSGWVFAGDATARARRTSAEQSDYIHIVNDNRFYNKHVSFPASNPPITSRFSAVNTRLCNSNGARCILVHPNCTRLITDLRAYGFKPGSRIPDTSDPTIGHMSDGLGYLIYQIWPFEAAVEHKGNAGILTTV